jgi:shikimate dehydrogenase
VIGSAVTRSLSPTLHNAAFRAAGLDWDYLAFEVAPPAEAARAAVHGMRALRGFDGMSVTHPHKLAATDAVDTLSTTAAELGAVNTVVRQPDGGLRGESTDGEGFLRALGELGFDPGGRRVLLVGAGGAARAVARALAGAGVSELVVVNRTPQRAQQLVVLTGPAARTGVGADAGECDLVVNATPLGSGGEDGATLPLDATDLGPGQLVVDLVYEPAVTPLLDVAEGRGCRVANGLAMLVHQAALQFELWIGEAAPLDAMWAAVQTRRRS